MLPEFRLNPVDKVHEMAVHEAGHAVAASALGAKVLSVTIDPEHAFSLGGPLALGEASYHWPEGQTDRTVLCSLVISVAGYVAAYVAYDSVPVNAKRRQTLLEDMRQVNGRGDYEQAMLHVVWLIERRHKASAHGQGGMDRQPDSIVGLAEKLIIRLFRGNQQCWGVILRLAAILIQNNPPVKEKIVEANLVDDAVSSAFGSVCQNLASSLGS